MADDFVVVAEFVVSPGKMEAFLRAALDDARHSVADEPGCRQFDVLQPEADRDVVMFYEVYDSRAAFDRHLEMPHLKRFQDVFPALIDEERPVRFAQRQYP